ncbi:hypothetical protein Tco_1091831 [Tanacetum coccineum]|uniref:Uncharacterized protein n=1 Tax=Tanacetum coccineum TaxID=301880 RepID=A0ABQ5I895_9ASTR
METIGIPPDKHETDENEEGKPLSAGKSSEVSAELFQKAHLYVIQNIDEIVPYIKRQKQVLKTENPGKRIAFLENEHSKSFANLQCEDSLTLPRRYDYDSPEPPKSLLKWYHYLSDEYKDNGRLANAKTWDAIKGKTFRVQIPPTMTFAEVKIGKRNLRSGKVRNEIIEISSDSSEDRKGASKATAPIFYGPSTQGLLDAYGYNTIEEYLSWNYFPSTDNESTDMETTDKRNTDKDCIVDSNSAMSKEIEKDNGSQEINLCNKAKGENKGSVEAVILALGSEVFWVVSHDKDGEDDQATRSEFERLLQQEKQTVHPNSTNSINTVSTPVSTAGPSCTDEDLSSPVNAAEASNAFEEHLFE